MSAPVVVAPALGLAASEAGEQLAALRASPLRDSAGRAPRCTLFAAPGEDALGGAGPVEGVELGWDLRGAAEGGGSLERALCEAVWAGVAPPVIAAVGAAPAGGADWPWWLPLHRAEEPQAAAARALPSRDVLALAAEAGWRVVTSADAAALADAAADPAPLLVSPALAGGRAGVEAFLDGLRSALAVGETRPWRWATLAEAARRCLGAPEPPPLVLNALRHGGEVSIWSSAPLHQPAPWIATRAGDGSLELVREGVVRRSPTRWRWRLPEGAAWTGAAVGGSTEDGRAATARVVDLDDPTARILPQPLRPDPVHPNAITEYGEYFARSLVRRSTGEAPEQDSVRQAVELLRERVRPGMSVLDVGCAAGHAWRSLRELGVEYHGIDPYTRAVEIGRLVLGAQGLPPDRLRDLALEDLPPDEEHDAVIALSTLLYFPMLHEPLALMARAARRWLVIRSSFAERTEIRYLPDILLEPGYEHLHAYFNVFGREEVEAFLGTRGFAVRWVPDRRQAERLGGAVETVGGIELPYEFLVAERVRRPSERELLGERFAAALADWRERRAGGPAA